MPDTASRRLPLTTVVAATVLALAAAAAVYVLLDRGDDDTSSESTGTIALTEDPGTAGDDPSTVEFEHLDGTTGTLAEFRGMPLVVNFFASACTPCITEMPDLEEASHELAGEVAIVGLAVNDRTEDAQALVDETGITYPWGLDRSGGVLTAVGGAGLPTTALFSADGELVTRHTGVLTKAELLALVDEHLT